MFRRSESSKTPMASHPRYSRRIYISSSDAMGSRLRHRDLNKSTMNIPSECRFASIAANHAMILPHDANQGRMQFSESTRTPQFECMQASMLALPDNTPAEMATPL